MLTLIFLFWFKNLFLTVNGSKVNGTAAAVQLISLTIVQLRKSWNDVAVKLAQYWGNNYISMTDRLNPI